MAQERKKTRIVLASILKPVDDTRMFEKMAVSLAKDDHNEIIVIGFPCSGKVQRLEYSVQREDCKVQRLELSYFKRLSFGRWLAKWKVFFKVLTLKPSVFIITTHELLLPAFILKVITNAKIIYDIQENYYRNILHSGNFPRIIRGPLAILVRLKEKILAPFVDHFLLAEKGYEEEFTFFKGSSTVIENKAMPSEHYVRKKRISDDHSIKLLFSGTLAESTGVFVAIELAKQLNKLNKNVTLLIIGKTSLKETLDKIHQEVNENSFITIIGGEFLVPHNEIINAIAHADAGILSYPLMNHIKNSKPTKLFEYLNGQLPIMLENRWPWIEEYNYCTPFIVFNFQKPDCSALIQSLKAGNFYPSAAADITWLSEEKQLLELLNKI